MDVLAVRNEILAPGCTPVGKDSALHLGHDGESVFHRCQPHACAAVLVFTIAAQAVLTAHLVQVELGDMSTAQTILAAQSNDLCMADLEVTLIFDRSLLEVKITAKASHFCGHADLTTFGRIIDIVTGIGHMLQCHTAGGAEVILTPSIIRRCILATVTCITFFRIPFITILAVSQRDIVGRILTYRAPQGDLPASILAHIAFLQVAIGIVIIIFIGTVVDAQRSHCFLLVDIGMAPGEGIALCVRGIAALFISNAHSVTSATEIGITNTYHTQDAIGSAVSSTNTERTRALFLDIQFHDNSIGFHTRIHLDIDILEEAQIIDALHGTAGLLGIEGFADLLAHLAQDDIVLGLGIALDLETFELALVDFQRQVPLFIDIHIRYFGQDITVLAVHLLDGLDILLQVAAVQDLTGLHRKAGHQQICLKHRITRDGHALEHRILQHMVSHDHAFRHLLEGREQIIEIARIIDGLAVCIQTFHREHIPCLHPQGCLGSVLRQRRSAFEYGIHNGLSFVFLAEFLDYILLRTILGPFTGAGIHIFLSSFCSRRRLCILNLSSRLCASSFRLRSFCSVCCSCNGLRLSSLFCCHASLRLFCHCRCSSCHTISRCSLRHPRHDSKAGCHSHGIS